MARIIRFNDDELDFLRFALECKLNEMDVLMPKQEPLIQDQMQKEESRYRLLLKKVRTKQN